MSFPLRRRLDTQGRVSQVLFGQVSGLRYGYHAREPVMLGEFAPEDEAKADAVRAAVGTRIRFLLYVETIEFEVVSVEGWPTITLRRFWPPSSW